MMGTIEEANDLVRRLAPSLEEGETVQAFVTGSLYLGGGALEVLEGTHAL